MQMFKMTNLFENYDKNKIISFRDIVSKNQPSNKHLIFMLHIQYLFMLIQLL